MYAGRFRRLTHRQPFPVSFNEWPKRSFLSVGVDIDPNAQHVEGIAFLLEGCLVVSSLHGIEEIEKAEDAFLVNIRQLHNIPRLGILRFITA